MAPELFAKNQTYDAEKVDMWAFGVIIYYLIEGVFPFRGYDEKDLARRMKQRDVQFKKTPKGLQ
jgi:MAP/microtubule affinity-regulating kinase